MRMRRWPGDFRVVLQSSTVQERDALDSALERKQTKVPSTTALWLVAR